MTLQSTLLHNSSPSPQAYKYLSFRISALAHLAQALWLAQLAYNGAKFTTPQAIGKSSLEFLTWLLGRSEGYLDVCGRHFDVC